jgi:photosystem II stability/assembly factor-like uncharacterized protein
MLLRRKPCRQEGKDFFFEKKKQKTFAILGGAWGSTAPKSQKFFGSFFQKRTAFFLLCFAAALPTGAHAVLPPVADTDQPLWRATHGLLLGIAYAGDRVVAVGNAGVVLLSDDDGQSWRIANTPSDELLTSVIFPTPKEGWAVGQDLLVLHSVDAGETWTQQHFTAGSDQVLFTVVSFSPGHLLATGSYNSVVETHDGASWQDSKIANLDDDYHLNCAAARGDDVMVTGEAGHAFVRYAGAWSAMKMDYEGSQFACLLGADGNFYSFGLRGSAFRAQPGAAAWTRIDLGDQQSIFGAARMADGRIALVGANGGVKLLDPASGKVTHLPQVSEHTLSAVVEGRHHQLIAVGDDGVHQIDTAAVVGAAP